MTWQGFQMTKLIVDTNIWYDIGAGMRDPVGLKTGGKLVAIPTSILEIASPHAEEKTDTWPKRRAAAQAIVDHADEIAKDTESHLAMLWDLPVFDAGNLWRDICETTAQSNSMDAAARGFEDHVNRVSRSLNVAAIQHWRSSHWQQFAEEVEDAIEQHAPGYKKARQEGKYKSLPKDKRAEFKKDLFSQEVRRVFIESTYYRALGGGVGAKGPTPQQFARSSPLLAPYIDAYTEYIHLCATSFAPQPNDFGDSECFIYLQDHHLLATSDKRWKAIAAAVSPNHLFQLP
jgi:hypothetical protein